MLGRQPLQATVQHKNSETIYLFIFLYFMNENTIVINGEEYVKKSSIQTTVTNTEGLIYSMVRTYSAGVFAGYIESRNGKEIVLRKARRIYSWA